ncbi:MAG: sialate O-acetylesterase [Aeoliella sp.]
MTSKTRALTSSVHAIYWALLTAAAVQLTAASVRAETNTLKIYLLAGQSNMVGQAYTWDNFATINNWNVPSLDYLTNNTAYFNSLPNDVFTFKETFAADWLTTPRNDAWAVHYDSENGQTLQVRATRDLFPGDNSQPNYPTGIQPLSVGFGLDAGIGVASEGTNITPSLIGAELSMGHLLGDVLKSPIFLFKSAQGGTTLAEDWRPPSAVAARGGSVGADYTNTINQFKSFLDDLDADLADNGVLDDYNNAVGYEVAGFVWLQGFNEVVENGGAFIPEYADNLVDLVNDIRDSDSRIGDDLPAIIVESSDQDSDLNMQRIAAASRLDAANAGSAVFIETNGLKDVNYGGLNSAGEIFSDNFGFHFHARPENFLQIGALIGDSILDNGFTGSESIPEPCSGLLLISGGLFLLVELRSRDRTTPETPN